VKPGAARAGVLAAALAGVALTLSLGLWQLDRAAQKLAIQAATDARAQLPPLTAAELARRAEAATAQHHRPVHLRGRWIGEHTVFLDNRQMNARVGFFVLTPLQIGAGGEAVLVQRGWAPRDQLDRSRLPLLTTPDGEVEVDGWVSASPSRLYDFGSAAGGAIRQNLDLDDFARETGLKLLPLTLLQRDAPATAGDGLGRQWPRVAVDVHKNYGYAFQWFAMAALMTGLYVWFQLIRPRLRRGST
jgi:surfeit locus 1 family protein